MSLSEPFIRRPVATTLVTIAIVLLGIVSYFQIGVASAPNVEFPVIFITTGLPGAKRGLSHSFVFVTSSGRSPACWPKNFYDWY